MQSTSNAHYWLFCGFSLKLPVLDWEFPLTKTSFTGLLRNMIMAPNKEGYLCLSGAHRQILLGY